MAKKKKKDTKEFEWKAKNGTETRLFAAQMIFELPAQQVTISIEQGFGWCTGEYKWFIVATKADKVEQREPAQTEEEARGRAIQWCGLAEAHKAPYKTEILLSLGEAPTK